MAGDDDAPRGRATIRLNTPPPIDFDRDDSTPRPQPTTGNVPVPAAINAGRVACLVILSGPHEGDVIGLQPGRTYVLGRGDDADIRIQDDGISRAHASVKMETGTVLLEDTGSRNGTFVGGQKIQRRALADED